jgi:LAO/AO transport system kinase
VTDFGDQTMQTLDAIRSGDRRALARAITLIESTRPDHRARADALIGAALPFAGEALRIGITGTPGVGKSTFVEASGLHLIDGGHRVAVLAVDPSSPVAGGAILGDKTRMENLARHRNAFIRPSPSGGSLGGVARRTRDIMVLVEAAGFDVVLVETVGVGQSETAVAGMVDLFMLLLAPAGGDDLQGIKKGVVELADLVVVNKADGALAAVAEQARRDYTQALHLLRPRADGWRVRVQTCSSVTGDGVGDVWATVFDYAEHMRATGGIDARRADQARRTLWRSVEDLLLDEIAASAAVRAVRDDLEAQVQAGRMAPHAAARRIIDAYKSGDNPSND